MSTLTAASTNWATRPADERFTSLYEMGAKMRAQRVHSKAVIVPSSKLEARPFDNGTATGSLKIHGPNGVGYEPTHWAFGQLSSLAEAPARYLRTLPGAMAADCINYGLQFKRDIKDTGVYIQKSIADDGTVGDATLRAVTGPGYGRIYNSDIIEQLIDTYGDGRTGDFRIPGEFGKQVDITKKNTTLFASDRDCFVFLADEENRIEMPDRRNGESGSLARGFFVSNSEVGNSTFDIETFLFDYVCMNRTVWGVTGHRSVKLRHTVSAPEKFMAEIAPALRALKNASTFDIVQSITAAKAAKIDNVAAFLAKRFSVKQDAKVVAQVQATHLEEEGRPIETLWDASVGITAAAKAIEWQDQRIAMERIGGAVLDLVAIEA